MMTGGADDDDSHYLFSSSWMHLLSPPLRQNIDCMYCLSSPPSVSPPPPAQLPQRPSNHSPGEREESDGAFLLRGFQIRQTQAPENVHGVFTLCHKTVPRRRLQPADACEWTECEGASPSFWDSCPQAWDTLTSSSFLCDSKGEIQ